MLDRLRPAKRLASTPFHMLSPVSDESIGTGYWLPLRRPEPAVRLTDRPIYEMTN